MNILGLIIALNRPAEGTVHPLIPLADISLIQHTFNAALESELLSRAVVATDDPRIARAAVDCSLEVPLLLPTVTEMPDLSIRDVALMTLKSLSAQDGWYPDIVVLLSPRTPLRTALHIDQALHLMEFEQADTVVSVVRVPSHFLPEELITARDGTLEMFRPESDADDWEETEDHSTPPVLYALNGPAVLATHSYVLELTNGLYGDFVMPFVMSQQESLQVELIEDLWMAEAILQNQFRLSPPLTEAD